MVRLLGAVSVMVACACTPAKVQNPYKQTDTSRVERDVTASAAPDSQVKKRDGSALALASLWEKQRVVVVFYMGGWCPHCQKQLGELNARQKEFADAGAIIIGVSADSSEDAFALQDKLGLNFNLYGDPGLTVIQAWGVAEFDAAVAKPSTFIVEPGGAISFRKVGANMNDRPSTDDVLAALQRSQ
jgi:peroxiredoxin